MRNLLKTLVLATVLLGAAATANAQISFGIHIGEPPAPRAYRVPPRPGPDYEWIEGYQYPRGGSTNGMTATGRSHRTRGPIGSRRTTTTDSTSPAIGKALTGMSLTTISGIEATSVTTV